MGIIQKDAFRTMLISYIGLALGYLNKGVLFVFILTTNQIGLINLIISIGLLFTQFASLGVFNTTMKFFPYFRNKTNENYGFLKLTIFITLIGSLLITIAVVVFKETITSFYLEKSSDFVTYYYWIIPVGIANVFYFLFENYLRGLYKNVFSAFVYEILLRAIVTVLLLFLYFDLISFNTFLIGNCLSFIIPVLFLFAYLVKLDEIKTLNVKIQIPQRFKGIIIKYGLYSYANSLGVILVITLDIAMIASMVGLSETGIYSTVIYLTSALLIPYRSIIRVSIPFVSIYWKEKKMKEMMILYKDTSSISIITGGFLFLMVWTNRVELFSFLPPEFMEGIMVFLFLMIGRLFDMYTGINSIILSTSKKYRVDILFTFVMIILVVTLNYKLIPIYGITGAAISTMIAIVVYNLLRLLYVWYKFKLHPFKLNQITTFLILGCSIFIGELIPTSFVNVFIQLIFKSLIISAVFAIPMLLFRIEPKLNDYLKKIAVRLKLTSQKP